MKTSDEISEAIQTIFFDIKAEALIGDLIENGLENEGFVAMLDGTFKRRYARDIAYNETIKLENGQKIVGIHINRDGLYDSLPEGLFHEKIDNPSKDSDNISEESKKLKLEEKAVREFFRPFENEVFFQRIQLELHERKILSRFSENLFNDIFPEFWNFDSSLSPKYISSMVLLLHFSHRIAGNSKLTEKCLEAILEEKVKVQVIRSKTSANKNINKSNSSNKNNLLGAIEMGVNFVCGDDFDGLDTTMVFDIGPLQNTRVDEYLENGTISNFLNCFYNYFVPAEFDVTNNILIDKAKQNFILTAEGPVLGYESAF